MGCKGMVAVVAAALFATVSAGADAVRPRATFETRAFLLDLARQTETVDFVNAYVDKAADAGFNTMLVYLKGVMRTKSFQLVPPERSYTVEQMRGIVEHAKEKGIEVIPYLSLLGHGEPYFVYPELVPLCEERDGASRWPSFPKATFCLSKPETRAFLESYFAEIAEAFPGRNFHVGMDETWNMGFCSLCAPRRRKIGFGGLYTEFVKWAHDLCERHGRRMWMWDDFYEFFPEELGNVPRDAVMCHWDYDSSVSLHGGRGKFLNRIRRDWLAEYDRLGMDVVVCSWRDPANIRSLTDYARRHRVKGAMLTIWEMGRGFWGTTLPKLYAAGRLWSDADVAADVAGDFLGYGIDKAFPMMSDEERSSMEYILQTPRVQVKPGVLTHLGRNVNRVRRETDEQAVRILGKSRYAVRSDRPPEDPLSPSGLVDDVLTEWNIRMSADVFRETVQILTDPRRTAADVKSAKKALAVVRARLAEAARRRRQQEEAWRPGCWPNEQGDSADRLVAFCDELLSIPEAPAEEDEWRLELGLHLHDYHGLPRWTVEARFGDEWREVAKGTWKPGEDGANFTRYFPFRSAVAPDQVRVSYHGNGAGGLNSIAFESPSSRLVPQAVLERSGDVCDADNLLVDSYEPAFFGTSDRRASFHDPSLAEKVSSVTLSLGPETLLGPVAFKAPSRRAAASQPAAVSVSSGVPSDAEVLFDGSSLEKWRNINGGKPSWTIQPDGTLLVNKEGNTPNAVLASIYTRDVYTNFQMHVEYRIPEDIDLSDKWRGNSGVKIFGCYEVQIIDSYGNPLKPVQMCGAIYSNCPPLVNASQKPGDWQALDIVFHAPVVRNGALSERACVSVMHNGVLVQDGSRPPPYPDKPEFRTKTCGTIELQSHNDHSKCISFRNVWIRRL